MDRRRSRRGAVYAEAHEELEFYFCRAASDMGVRAQSYDHDGSSGGQVDPDAMHVARSSWWHRRAVRRWDAVHRTLGVLTHEVGWTLALAYRGVGASLRLRDALSTPTGVSLVGVASMQSTAARRAHEEHQAQAEASAAAKGLPAPPRSWVVGFLEWEIGRGNAKLMRQVRGECLTRYEQALAAYDAARRVRLERERQDDQERLDAILAVSA